MTILNQKDFEASLQDRVNTKLNYLANNANQIDDWNPFFDYDPFLGRLPPGFENK